MTDQVRYAAAGSGPLPPVRCPRCGELNAPRATECSVCGAALPKLVVVEDGDASKWEGWNEAEPENAQVVESEEAAEAEKELTDSETALETDSRAFSADELIKDDQPAVPPDRPSVPDDFEAEPQRGLPWKAIAAVAAMLALIFVALYPFGKSSHDVGDGESVATTVQRNAATVNRATETEATPATGNAVGNETQGGIETLGGSVLTLSDTALMGDLDGMKKLLASGANPNEPDKKGWTPLMNAAAMGKTEAARLLLDNKADPNAVSSEGDSAMNLAATFGSAGCISLLAGAGGDLNAPNAKGATPLLAASSMGHTEAVQTLLDKGADPNKARADNGYTPLMAAASNGRVAAVKALLAAKADLTATYKDGNTALQMAIIGGHEDVAQLLRAAGAK